MMTIGAVAGLLIDEHFQGHRIQILDDMSIQCGPQLGRQALPVAGGASVALAAGRRDLRTINCSNDVKDRDSCRITHEFVAAAGTARRFDQACTAKLSNVLKTPVKLLRGVSPTATRRRLWAYGGASAPSSVAPA